MAVVKEPSVTFVQTEDTLGVSVYHLKHVFLEQEVLQDTYSSRDSTIYELEDLQQPHRPGLIRRKGQDISCPIDGRLGAAYVHCLEGADHVGQATHMLSYSWA